MGLLHATDRKEWQFLSLKSVSAVSAEFRESQFIQLLSRFDIDSFRDAAPGLG
jgi:hypothetical protein